MVQVRVLGIALDAAQQHIVLLQPLLRQGNEARVLPIWIGGSEATSILLATSGAKAPRPLSHDLMKMLVEALDAEVERVEVTRLEEGTFYAEITVIGRSGRHIVDARPSDAIGLALRADAPLFVAEEVLEAAGIPDSMIEVESSTDEEDPERSLDDFRRFLDEVDPEDFQG
jgi:bifunctional DNase/RNase